MTSLGKALRSVPRSTVTALVVLVAIKLLLQLGLYGIGFTSVSADEFARGTRVAAWLETDDAPLPLYTRAWLPFEFYLNAAAISLWDDVFWAPRLTVLLASLILLIAYFLLVRQLFDDVAVAFLAALMLVFYPWYAWLSGTPMLDVYYLAFFVPGLYFLILAMKRRRSSFLVPSSIFFIVSTGFHSQSWLLVNVVNFIFLSCLTPDLIKKKSVKFTAACLVYLIANNLFVGYYLLVEFFDTGRWFAFFEAHKQYSESNWDLLIQDKSRYWRGVLPGYDVEPLLRLAYYPALLIASAPVLAVLVPPSLYANRPGRSGSFMVLLPFLLGATALLVYSIFNLFSVPATSARARYALPFFILFSPYMAHGLVVLLGRGGWLTSRWNLGDRSWPVVCGSLAVILSYAWPLAILPPSQGVDALEAGRYVDQLIERSDWRPGDSFIVELDYWGFWQVELTARHYPDLILDRPFDPSNRETVSMFIARSHDEIKKYLRQNNVRVIVVNSPEIEAKLEGLDAVSVQTRIGRWTVYRVD